MKGARSLLRRTARLLFGKPACLDVASARTTPFQNMFSEDVIDNSMIYTNYITIVCLLNSIDQPSPEQHLNIRVFRWVSSILSSEIERVMRLAEYLQSEETLSLCTYSFYSRITSWISCSSAIFDMFAFYKICFLRIAVESLGASVDYRFTEE